MNQLHQVYGKMINQTKIPTYHRKCQLCKMYTGTQGDKRTILINLMKNCVPPMWYGEGMVLFLGVVVTGYLRCSDGMSCSTSSHIWSSWYFLRFLLRHGSFTQKNMAFLMVMVMLYVSLSMMVKHSTSAGCPLVWLHW